MNIKQIAENDVISLYFSVMFLVMSIILSWESYVIFSDPHISLIGRDAALLLVLSVWGVEIFVATNAVIDYLRNVLHARKVER
jgi:hypothetical protein